MKWLFEFTVNKETKETKKESTTNENGEKVTVEKESSSFKPTHFAIKRPNRKLYDEADLFYSVKLSDGIKAGLLTRALLEKRYENDGGVFNEYDRDRYVDLYKKIFEKENALQKVALNLENRKEDDKTSEMAELYADLTLLRKELQEYEVRYSSLFDQTAENRAKNQTVMWWVLHLGFHKQNEDEEYASVFSGKDYDEKLDSYDEYEDMADLFWDESIKKLIYFVSFWNSGQGSSPDDFKNAEEFYNDSYNVTTSPVLDDPESVVEEVKNEIKEEAKTKPKKKTAKSKSKKKKVEAAPEEQIEEPAAETVSE